MSDCWGKWRVWGLWCTSWALNGDDAGADVDFNALGDDELLLREDVLHLERLSGGCGR